ncbi:MAG: DUF3179 domain-containing protein [Gammaproteobacteria bacterium]|nr:DUF3179 domain-containing protein [Gammaproteobacteria bacterium]
MRHPTWLRIILLGALLGVLYNVLARSGDNGFALTGTLVPADEIHLGGPPRDGIPAIDAPRFVAAADADFLAADDRVLGIVHAGVARAYPVAILNWHEVVNDRIADDPVAITYCPLCGTGIAFAAGSADAPRSFGVSGLLYNSDVLLYDRETESLWSQLMMRAVSGPLSGERLTALPLSHTSWDAWRTRHPDSQVLSPDTGFDRDYDRDPYAGYAGSDQLLFPVSAQSRRYHPKEQVLGITIDGSHKAYPFTELDRTGHTRIDDTLAGRPIRIQFDATSRSADAFDADGTALPGVTSFWFAWYTFHPDTEVFEAP